MRRSIIIIGFLILMIMLGGGAFWFKSQSDDLLQATTDSRIRVTTPRAGDSISSPLSITGEARGTWFFEASFPVVLTDWDGLIIAQGVAQAQSEWMTEEFVPFQAALNFTKPNNGNPHGTLILQRDNPSGLSQNDAAVEIPILFK